MQAKAQSGFEFGNEILVAEGTATTGGQAKRRDQFVIIRSAQIGLPLIGVHLILP